MWSLLPHDLFVSAGSGQFVAGRRAADLRTFFAIRLIARAVLSIAIAVWSGMGLADDASTIPIEDFFRPPAFDQVRISPDGKHLSLLMAVARTDGAHNLAVLPADDPQPRIITGYADNYDVVWHRWANDDQLVFALHYDRDEPAGMASLQGYYRIGRDGKNGATLWADQGGETPRVALRLPTPRSVRDRLLVNGWPMSNPSSDAWWLHVEDNRPELAASIEGGAVTWASDHEGNVRAAVQIVPEAWDRYAVLATKDGSEWHTVIEDRETDVRLVGLEPQTGALLVAHRRNNRAAIWRFDETGARDPTAVADNDIFDVGLAGTPVQYDDRGRPIWVNFEAERPARIFLDDGWRQRQERIDAALPETHNTLVDWDRGLSRFVVLATGDRVSGDYYLYDEDAGSLRFLVSRRPWLNPKSLARTLPIRLESRDGLTLHGYLTRPEAVDDQPGPLVMLIHDGPYLSRDRWHFDPEVQFLASRGYSVLQINYRGSAGMGREFERAGHSEWGRGIQRDLADALAWAIEQGHASSDAVCLMGSGFGGYSALVGASRAAGNIRCAISYGGFTDLTALYEEETYRQIHNAYHARRELWWRHYLRQQVGDDRKVTAPSPIDLVDDLDAAVFVAHRRGRLPTRERVNNPYEPVFDWPYIGPRTFIIGPRNFIFAQRNNRRDQPDYREFQYQNYLKALRKAGRDYEAMDLWKEQGAHRFDQTVTGFYSRIEKFLAQHLPVRSALAGE